MFNFQSRIDLSILFILSFLALINIIAASNSGLKFAINTEAFKLLKKIDYNIFFRNKILVPKEGFNYEKKRFPSVKLHVDNMIIKKIKKPSKIDVNTRSNSDHNYLSVFFNDIIIDITLDFNLRVMSIIKTRKTQVPLTVYIRCIRGEIYFDNGDVHFTQLKTDFGKIDIDFKSKFLNFVYSIFKNQVKSSLSSVIEKSTKDIEKVLSGIIKSDFSVDSGWGFGFNVTNVERPQLLLIGNSSQTEEYNLLSEDSLAESMNFTKLINMKNESSNNNTHLVYSENKNIITFGIHGSVYSTSIKQPNIKPAVPMEFIRSTFDNKLSILISDYSLNTILHIAQQSNALKKVFNNNTKVFNFNIDTEGISQIIPQFSKKFPENVPMEIKIFVNAFKHQNPIISSSKDGAILNCHFGLDFKVINSDDPDDFPVDALSLDAKIQITLKLNAMSGKLSINVVESDITEIKIKESILEVEETELKSALKKLMTAVIEQYTPLFSEIDLAQSVSDITGISFNKVFLKPQDEYIVLSIDVNDQ